MNIPLLDFTIPPRIANGIIIIMTLTILVLGYLLLFVPAPTVLGTLITVSEPVSGAIVSNDFYVRGEARGPWYFEASFPIEVRSDSGRVVGHGIAQAQGDWMTKDFVPFSAEVHIAGYAGPATLILRKDNPSGLPEHDDSISIPVVVR